MGDSTTYNEARDTAGLLDSSGRPVSRAPAAGALEANARDIIERTEDYIRTKPIKAAAVALGIGYIIGRLRLIV